MGETETYQIWRMKKEVEGISSTSLGFCPLFRQPPPTSNLPMGQELLAHRNDALVVLSGQRDLTHRRPSAFQLQLQSPG